MAGSRRNFGYTTDGGVSFYMQLDESVYERPEYGMAQTIASAVYNDLSKRLKPSTKFPIEPRYILCSRTDADGRVVNRKVYVGSVSAIVWGAGITTATLDDGTYTIRAKVGEKRHLPPGFDTGLIDGDVDVEITATP